MQDLVKRCRDALLATEDTVCLERARLVTEAYREHEHEPAPLRRAKAFAHVLSKMTLDLASNPVFAGNTSSRPRAWMLVPEHGMRVGASQIVVENECLAGFLDDRIPADLGEFWRERSVGGTSDGGHLAVDLHRVVHEGLDSLLARTRECADDGDADARVHRQAMAIALQAVVDWAGRYAEAADEAAQATSDPVLRAAHRRVATACRHVPARPARDLFEGLQAIVLVHLALAIEGHGMSVSVGLPDRVLAPLAQDADPNEAVDLIGAFMLKLTANSIFGRASKTQAITVGGADATGRDQCSVVTRWFLDACDQLRVGDPHLFLRWHDGLAPAIKSRAMEMLAAGVSMPLLINDRPTVQGLVNAGIVVEDAWDYCVIGCNELGIPGRSAESATSTCGLVQYLELLNQVLLEHPDASRIGSVAELLTLLEDRMLEHLSERRQRGRVWRARAARRMPTPFSSALMHGCIERGRDMRVGMEYCVDGLYERGLSNAANALAAVEQLVFEEGVLTMTELVEAMRCNFEGSAVRDRLLAAPKWGNDDDRADRWALALVRMRERVLEATDAEADGAAHMVCHVVRSLHYTDGRRVAASPDGRFAWTPVADSIGAQAGTAHAGPTATLNSVLKLDASRYYRGGTNLNLTLPSRETTPDTVQSLVEGFFGRGGQELQINCLDADVLRHACECPEQYSGLLVRVAGFTARFIDLSHVEQQELIARADAAADSTR